MSNSDRHNSLDCSRCGNPVIFEFTVESSAWNRIVRSRGIAEYLCFWCFDELAADERVDRRIPVGVNLGGQIAFSSWCGDDVPGAYSEQRSKAMNSTDRLEDAPNPINMLLFCPECHTQHIDKPEGLWTNPPHKSHLCHFCETIWRPADVPTNGVQAITTSGEADTWRMTRHQS